MTAAATTGMTSRADAFGAAFRGFRFRPAEGWLTLLAAILMVVAFAGSLVDARWTTARAGDPIFLVWIAPLGVLWGLIGAKVGWGRWRTHLVGALIAGLLLPLFTGGVVLEQAGTPVGWDPAGLAARMQEASAVANRVWTDLVVLDRPFTGEEAHYHLVFGALVLGAGMLTGFSVFGHRRPLDAVVVVGLAVIANMALTEHIQLTLMVLFTIGALLLLVRTHVFEEEVTWARRKIGDPASVGQLYLRGGALFVAAAVIGSVLLTVTASSAPLQGFWRDVPQHLQGISQFLARIAPGGGDVRNPGGIIFGDTQDTSGVWEPNSQIAFRAQLQQFELATFKWRAGVFDIYTGNGWDTGQTREDPAAARDDVMAGFGTGERPSVVGRRQLTAQIRRDAYGGDKILSPNMLQRVDRTTVAKVIGDNGWFANIVSNDDLDVYNITALILVQRDQPGSLTQARLRAAGTEYPADLLQIYTALPDNALGPEAEALLATIQARVRTPEGVDPQNPFDLARTMEEYLSGDAGGFAYQDNVRDLRATTCVGISSVECFAIIKRGYCEYYASTMTVLLRRAGVPARLAYGFLPGERGADNLEVVPGSAAHQWVEVYFPGTGWVEFDPTGGGVGVQNPLPSGSVGVPTPAPSRPSATFPDEPTEPPVGGPGANPTGGGSIGPFIAIALILALGVAALVYASYRRTPNHPMHPDKAWGSLARLAARFGLGPRPSQTVYEYAGVLGDEVPAARVELTTIARAKVEVAYGRADLENDRLKSIAQAYHRLRYAILNVVLRRGLRRNKRR